MSDKRYNDTAPWYVLCHLNPQWIEVMLKKESEGRFAKTSVLPSPFRFYVPFLYMPAKDSLGVSGYATELRNDFHSFVFIQAPHGRIDEILSSDWNTKARLHLYYYRDHEGKPVVVADAEIRRLMSTFRDETLRFFIGNPVDDFSAGDKVILNIEPWVGQEGVVKDIRLKKGKLVMTISMNIFNRTRSINFIDLHTGDITFKDADKARLLTNTPIDCFEEEVVDLLSHRLGKSLSEEVAQSDTMRLRHLSTFDRLYMEPDEPDYSRFLSLRLICAVLRQSKRRRASLQQEVETRLSGKETPTTTDEAYLMVAMFIATRRAAYRDAVKAYRSTHPDCPDILRRYHSIVKNLKAKPVK